MNAFVFVLLLVATILGYDLAARAMRRRDSTTSEETQLMQEIYRGLQRMEQRVEALETILIEKASRKTFEEANY